MIQCCDVYKGPVLCHLALSFLHTCTCNPPVTRRTSGIYFCLNLRTKLSRLAIPESGKTSALAQSFSFILSHDFLLFFFQSLYLNGAKVAEKAISKPPTLEDNILVGRFKDRYMKGFIEEVC